MIKCQITSYVMGDRRQVMKSESLSKMSRCENDSAESADADEAKVDSNRLNWSRTALDLVPKATRFGIVPYKHCKSIKVYQITR